MLVTFSIIGYTMSLYIDLDDLNSSGPEKKPAQPKQYIDHARQATDELNETLKKQKKS